MANKKLRHKRISFEVYERSGNVVPIRARHPEVSHLTISAWLDRNVFFPGIILPYSSVPLPFHLIISP